jgi:hypothetical protein
VGFRRQWRRRRLYLVSFEGASASRPIGFCKRIQIAGAAALATSVMFGLLSLETVARFYYR